LEKYLNTVFEVFVTTLLGGHRGFAYVLKLWQATNREFRGTLQYVTGTCAGWRMRWPGVLSAFVSPMQPTLPYTGQRVHARLTVLRLSV